LKSKFPAHLFVSCLSGVPTAVSAHWTEKCPFSRQLTSRCSSSQLTGGGRNFGDIACESEAQENGAPSLAYLSDIKQLQPGGGYPSSFIFPEGYSELWEADTVLYTGPMSDFSVKEESRNAK
jgi:hypothetical protein